jgi:membrane fusion protein, multidrug efflux system
MDDPLVHDRTSVGSTPKYMRDLPVDTQVHFKLPRGAESLRVAANTLLFRSTDLQVAVVGTDHRVTLKNITTGRDFGTSLEVLTGLAPGDDIIVNPSDSIATRTVARVLPPPPPP